MKYRLIYEYLFLPDSKNGIKLSDETIKGLSIYVKFKVFYKGKEILFEGNTPDDKVFVFDEYHQYYLSTLIKCIFDKTSFYKFLPTAMLEYVKSRGYEITYDVDCYAKSVSVDEGFSEEKISTKEEFERIYLEHLSEFDNSDNYPAQTTSYFSEVI